VQVFVDGMLHISQDATLMRCVSDSHRNLLLKARVNQCFPMAPAGEAIELWLQEGT
jgi:hypothetical protein